MYPPGNLDKIKAWRRQRITQMYYFSERNEKRVSRSQDE